MIQNMMVKIMQYFSSDFDHILDHPGISPGYTVLLRDLGFAYDQLRCAGASDNGATAESVRWPSPAPQYGHYARQETTERSSRDWKNAMDFWRQKLQPAPPQLTLPGAQRELRERNVGNEISSDLNFTGSKVDFELSRDLSEKLCALSSRFGASIHATLLAAWMVLLSRYAEEDAEDVCVGTPFACRTTAESEGMVGYFVTPLCIRAHVSGSFDALLQQVYGEVQSALRFQRVPLNEVCEELSLEQRHILQAMFVFQTCPELGQELPSFLMGHEGSELPLGSELQLESMAIGQRHAQFDLALMMAFSPSQQLIGNFQYSFASYSRDTVLRLQSQLQRLLEKIVSNPEQNVTQIPFIDVEDLQLPRAISPWQDTKIIRKIPADKKKIMRLVGECWIFFVILLAFQTLTLPPNPFERAIPFCVSFQPSLGLTFGMWCKISRPPPIVKTISYVAYVNVQIIRMTCFLPQFVW